MGWNFLAPKAPAADTSYHDADKARQREGARQRRVAADAVAQQQDSDAYYAEIMPRRAALRAKCTMSNHDRCLSH
jgi:hypothetical protein